MNSLVGIINMFTCIFIDGLHDFEVPHLVYHLSLPTKCLDILNMQCQTAWKNPRLWKYRRFMQAAYTLYCLASLLKVSLWKGHHCRWWRAEAPGFGSEGCPNNVLKALHILRHISLGPRECPVTPNSLHLLRHGALGPRDCPSGALKALHLLRHGALGPRNCPIGA
jgi:hypothetical protein